MLSGVVDARRLAGRGGDVTGERAEHAAHVRERRRQQRALLREPAVTGDGS